MYCTTKLATAHSDGLAWFCFTVWLMILYKSCWIGQVHCQERWPNRLSLSASELGVVYSWSTSLLDTLFPWKSFHHETFAPLCENFMMASNFPVLQCSLFSPQPLFSIINTLLSGMIGEPVFMLWVIVSYGFFFFFLSFLWSLFYLCTTPNLCASDPLPWGRDVATNAPPPFACRVDAHAERWTPPCCVSTISLKGRVSVRQGANSLCTLVPKSYIKQIRVQDQHIPGCLLCPIVVTSMCKPCGRFSSWRGQLRAPVPSTDDFTTVSHPQSLCYIRIHRRKWAWWWGTPAPAFRVLKRVQTMR